MNHDLNHFRRRIRNVKHVSNHELEILPSLTLRIANPVQHSTPVMPSEQHYRKVSDLLRLNQRERFEEFVESAEAAGKDDEARLYFTNIILRTKKYLNVRLRVW